MDKKAALNRVMVWRWTRNKPLPEPVLAQFTAAYIRHQASMS